MDIRRALTTGAIFLVIFLVVQYLTSMWTAKPAGAGAAAAPPVAYAVALTQPAAAEDGAIANPFRIGDPAKASKDKLALTINPITAGIDLIELNVNDYAETVKGMLPLKLLEATPGLPKPYATLGIHLTVGNSTEELPLGLAPIPPLNPDPSKNADRIQKIHDGNNTAIYDTQYVWKLTKKTTTEADLLLTIDDLTGKPIAEITKIFRIDPASYNVLISHEIKNLSPLPIRVAIDQMAGTDLPRQALSNQDDRFFHAAALSTTTKLIDPDRANIIHTDVQKLTDASKVIGQLDDYSPGNDPYVWVAASNRFFVAITPPLPQFPGAVFALSDGRKIPKSEHVAQADVEILRRADTALDSLLGIRLTGNPVTVAANSSTSLALTNYFGPKKRDLLAGKAGAPVGSPEYDYEIFQYAKIIQFSRGGCYKFCTFDILATTILWLLDVLANSVAFHNYGIAIMILVILIRAVLHPLTRASQINMATMGKKMNTIKPLLEASKKRYADDKKKAQEDQMRIYRENNVNPAGGILGCLPMLIQMPIWIAMYSGLYADIDLRHAAFIPGWINDLSSPDKFITFPPFNIPLLSSLMGPIARSICFPSFSPSSSSSR